MATDITGITNLTSASNGTTSLVGIKAAATSINTNKAELVSPSFTTPTLGVALATSINGNFFTTGSSTYTGTAGQTYTFPTTSATIARTDAANTFTGTQTIGALVATTVNGNTFTTGTGVLTIAASKTLTASNTLTLAGTDGKGINVGAATSGKILIGDGSNMVLSTPTYPTAAGTSGNLLTSDGTNWNSTAPAASTAEWTYVSKVTFSDGNPEAKSFTSLTARDTYKLVIRLHNLSAAGSTRMTLTMTLNAVGAGYIPITRTTTGQTIGGSAALVTLMPSTSDNFFNLEGEVEIQGKHYNGLKLYRAANLWGMTGAAQAATGISGILSGDSADVSSIELSGTFCTGTIELWYKNAQ